MKSRNLINQAIEISTEEPVKNLLANFLLVNDSASAWKFDLTKFLAKSEEEKRLRQHLTGIHHAGGISMATDAHILCAIANEYPVDYEGKIVDKDGKFMEKPEKWVWRSVLPKKYKKNITRLDVDEAFKELSTAKKLAKVSRKTLLVEITMSSGQKMYLHGDRFLLFLTFLRTYPTSKLYISDPRTSILAEDNLGNLCLLMPTIEPSRYDCETYYHVVSISTKKAR